MTSWVFIEARLSCADKRNYRRSIQCALFALTQSQCSQGCSSLTCSKSNSSSWPYQSYGCSDRHHLYCNASKIAFTVHCGCWHPTRTTCAKQSTGGWNGDRQPTQRKTAGCGGCWMLIQRKHCEAANEPYEILETRAGKGDNRNPIRSRAAQQVPISTCYCDGIRTRSFLYSLVNSAWFIQSIRLCHDVTSNILQQGIGTLLLATHSNH